MRKIIAITMLTGASVMLAACSAPKTSTAVFLFPIMNADGTEIGDLRITPLAKGGVDVDVSVKGLSVGTHAMHFHEFGKCEGPDYKSAGGHYNPTGVAHGKIEDGPHAGDMMNVEVNADGKGHFKVRNMKVNFVADGLPKLMDADGTALIIHGGADDYKSQPSGAAGPRVACAVIPAG